MKRRLPTGTYRRGRSWYWRTSIRGRSKAKGGFVSQEAAKQALAEFKAEQGLRPLGAVGAPGFATAAKQYQAQVLAQHVNPRGERYALALLMARWGDRALESLTIADVDAYKTWRAQQPAQRRHPMSLDVAPRVKGSTVNRDLALLSAFFGWCQERGWLRAGWNPARARSPRRRGAGVARFPEPWRPWQSLAPSQQGAFLGRFDPRDQPKVELLLELGVRLAVILHLEWPQLDLTTGLLHYTSKRRSVVRPLPPRALAILAGLGPQARGRVFSETSDTRIRRAWPAACRAVGLSVEFRRHDLRVTFARRAADHTDLKTVADLMGHATITMAARYVPTSLQAQRQAVARIATAVATGTRPSRRIAARTAGIRRGARG